MMANRRFGISWLFVLVLMIACSTESNDWKETSLLDYGVPITILAPDSLDVKRSSIGFQEDITIRSDDDFHVQIFVSDAVTDDLSKAIKAQRESVQENPYFYAFVDEQEDGFIFENRIDSTQTFGFRHVRLMGGKEYVFQEPLVGSLSEEQATEMFEAVSYEVK
ncbi:MAG: hypothetical protein R3275_11290 [Saprospiraceae bacterium]|nr:hypothetical protein [Saprospiraceae bacterium]